MAWAILGSILGTVGVIVIVGLVGGGETSEAGSSPARFVATSSTTTHATSTTVPPPALRHRWTAKGEAVDGSTYEVVLEQLAITPPDRIEAAFGFKILSGYTTTSRYCQPDRQRDAFAPFKVYVRSTTGQFSVKNFGVTVLAYHRGTTALGGNVSEYPNPYGVTADGQCFDRAAVQTAWDLPPNGQTGVLGAVVLPDYYSPAVPEGNTKQAASLRYTLIAKPGFVKITKFEVAGDMAQDCETSGPLVKDEQSSGLSATDAAYACLDASVG